MTEQPMKTPDRAITADEFLALHQAGFYNGDAHPEPESEPAGFVPFGRSRWTSAKDVDDRFPTKEEVDRAFRGGVCDTLELVGQTVLFHSYGGYTVPAMVTCVRTGHPSLPLVHGALEGESVRDFRGQSSVDAVPGEVLLTDFGYLVGENPVPVPLEGTVHLLVFTSGPGVHFQMHSVPYSATRRDPGTWSYHPSSSPF